MIILLLGYLMMCPTLVHFLLRNLLSPLNLVLLVAAAVSKAIILASEPPPYIIGVFHDVNSND